MKREEIFKKPSVGRVFAGGVWFFLVTSVAGLLPWIVTLLAGRPEVLGPEGVEFYTTSWALVAVCELAGLGLGSAFVRLVAEAHERDEEEGRIVAANATIFMLVLGVVISVVFFALSFLLTANPQDRLAFSFVGLAVPLLYLRDPVVSMISSMHRFDYSGIANASGFIGILIVGGPLIVLRSQEYAPYLAATVPAYALLSLLAALHFFRKVSPYPLRSLLDTSTLDGRTLSVFLRRGLWIALTGLVAFGTTISLSISTAKALIPQRELAGLFGVAAGYGWTMMLVTSMTGPLIPELARAKERGDEELVRETCHLINKYAYGAAALLTMVYLAAGELILFAINGPDYVLLGGAPVVKLFVTGMLLYGVANVYGSILVGLGRERDAGVSFLASHLLLVLISLWFSRMVDPLQAVPYSLLLSSFVPLLFLSTRLLRAGVPIYLKEALRPLFAGLVTFLIGWKLVPSSSLFPDSAHAFLPMLGWSCALGVLYFFLLAFTGHYNETDYRMIEDTAKGIHPALLSLTSLLIRVLRFMASLNPFLRRS